MGEDRKNSVPKDREIWETLNKDKENGYEKKMEELGVGGRG